MDRRSVIEWAGRLGLGHPDSTSNAVWLNFKCPFAPWKHSSGRDRNASFGIKVDAKRSHYWCFTCHSKGDVPDLAYELGRLRKTDYTGIGREIERVELLGPQLYIPKWDDPRERDGEEPDNEPQTITYPPESAQYEFHSAAGHPYLASRGVSAATAIALGLRYDPRQRRVLFPVCSCAGRFAGFSGRAVDPPAGRDGDGRPLDARGRPFIKARDYLGLRKRAFFLGEHRIRGARLSDGVRHTKASPLVIVEGLFDYAYLAELGIPNVLAVLGTHVTPEKLHTLLKLDRPVLLWLDNDGPGLEATATVVDALFGKLPLKSVAYPEGYEDSDPASLPPSIVHQMYRDAEIVLDKNRIPR